MLEIIHMYMNNWFSQSLIKHVSMHNLVALCIIIYWHSFSYQKNLAENHHTATFTWFHKEGNTKSPLHSCIHTCTNNRNVIVLPGSRVAHTRDRKVFNQESRQANSPFGHAFLILEYQVDHLSRINICKYVIHKVPRKQFPTKPCRVPR